jgi:glycosyltransferase involved in cell wall biosynthesis
LRKLRVLLYGDVDLNIMDGSAVWLTSLANVLNKDENINIDVLLKAPNVKKRISDSIQNLNRVNVIDTFTRFKDRPFDNRNRMNVNEALKLIEELDSSNGYDCIIIRGINIVTQMHNSNLKNKTIPYVTDFTHDKSKIENSEIELLKSFYNDFPYMFVQTEQMKNTLSEMISVAGDKFKLISPMIPDYVTIPKFRNQNNSLIYAGKFAEEWNTEEILDSFKGIQELDPTITLNIAGDKFQGNLIQNKDNIIERFKTQSGVNWVGGVSRDIVQELLTESDVGVAWRSIEIDNDNSVELSTKLLEYGRAGKPILLRRTKIHEEVLGANYPLFVNTEEEFMEKAIKVLYDRNLYRTAAKIVFQACKRYTFSEIYQTIKPLLWSFHKGKTNILFAGHDLKFLRHTIEFFERSESFNVKIDQWKGHNTHDVDTSKQLRDWADIVFCEWGLGNAVWYSKNKKEGQKLIVRMHLQERETEHPNNFNMEKIDRIIAISPYIYEEFSRVCKIPREKMTMIYNMIDTQKLDLPKGNLNEVKYNLGICGVLPSRKRLDKAITIFEKLWEKDKRYKLFIKSRLPKDLPWLKNRTDEMEFYDEVFEKIENSPWAKNVIFDQHGSDMQDWFRKIGYVLSTSDFESFHLAPMEGMSSGSLPVVLHWPGAETIYSEEFLFKGEEQAVKFILENKKFIGDKSIKEYPKKNFDIKVINEKIHNLIVETL